MKHFTVGIISKSDKSPYPACGVENKRNFKISYNLDEVKCKKCLRRKEWVLYCIYNHKVNLKENLKVFEEIYQ